MWVLLLALAYGNETFDAHGFRLGAFTDDPASPLQMTLPGTWKAQSWWMGGLLEYAESPLIRLYSDGTQEAVLDDLFALNLSGGWAPHGRVRLTASAPLFFASMGDEGANGADLGDLRLGADAVLLDGVVSLGVNPYVDIPTGATRENLGQGGLAGGGMFTGRVRFWRLSGGVAMGPYFRPDLDLSNLQGVDRWLTGLHAGVLITDRLGFNVEFRGESPFVRNDYAGTDRPMEVLFHARQRFDSGFHLVMGGATTASWGASAARFRLFVGGGFGHYPEVEPEFGNLAVEVTLGGQSLAGIPTSLEGVGVENIVSGAQPVMLTDLPAGEAYRGTAEVGCLGGVGRAFVIANDTAPLIVELARLNVPVRVIVVDQDDNPVQDATVAWESDASSCVPTQPLTLRGTNEGEQDVGVGSHAVLVTAEGYGSYREDVTLVRGDERVIRAVLQKPKVVVTREKIEILDKVFFAFDGDEIDLKSGPLLDEVAQTLLDHPEVLEVEVAGHTDWEGDDDYNMDLSQRRVNRVREWLIDKGVAPERLVAKGYGESAPIASNATEAGRAENRRVEFNILKRDEDYPVEEEAAPEPPRTDEPTPPEPAAPEPSPAPEEPAAPEPSPAPEEPAAPEPAPAPEEPAAPEPAPAPEEPAAPEPAPAPEEPAAPEPALAPEEIEADDSRSVEEAPPGGGVESDLPPLDDLPDE
jgi:outer membrane protein OmpA-like peptidoglycan-associated protein